MTTQDAAAPPLTSRNDQRSAYAELRRQIAALGLFERQPRFYTLQALWVAGLFAIGITFALIADHVAIVLAMALLLGGASVQAEMLGHDMGHRQVLRTPRWPHVVGLALGNLLLGISYSFWIDKHDRHHVYPNHPTKDPDGNYDVLALTHDQIATRKKLFQPLVAFQAFLFPFWLLFQPLLMRKSGVGHIIKNHPTYWKAEVVALAVHATLYSLFLVLLGNWAIALAFVAIHQGFMGLYNGFVFAPNHKGMAIVDDEAKGDHIVNQIITARNVRGGFLVDTYFGGLNHQIEHHLFPTMPRNRLRRVQPLVEDFCVKQGIPYETTSFIGAYVALFTHLHRVGAPLRRASLSVAEVPAS